MLIAGLFPYLLGAALAFFLQGEFHFYLFLVGFVGILFCLLGVESFNEYFDWQLGTDRIFQCEPKPITLKTFIVGVGAFFIAFLIGLYLTYTIGFAIIAFAFFGFLAALFYLCPPIKLTYRGLGELIIALAYGPFMVGGSYFVQTRQLEVKVFFISLVPALLLFAIAVLNEIPDFIQDSLVGKRNICVRLGQRRALILAFTINMINFVILIVFILSGDIHWLNCFSLLCIPAAVLSFLKGMKTYQKPALFLPTIRSFLIQYVAILSLLIISCII